MYFSLLLVFRGCRCVWAKNPEMLCVLSDRKMKNSSKKNTRSFSKYRLTHARIEYKPLDTMKQQPVKMPHSLNVNEADIFIPLKNTINMVGVGRFCFHLLLCCCCSERKKTDVKQERRRRKHDMPIDVGENERAPTFSECIFRFLKHDYFASILHRFMSMSLSCGCSSIHLDNTLRVRNLFFVAFSLFLFIFLVCGLISSEIFKETKKNSHKTMRTSITATIFFFFKKHRQQTSTFLLTISELLFPELCVYFCRKMLFPWNDIIQATGAIFSCD